MKYAEDEQWQLQRERLRKKGYRAMDMHKDDTLRIETYNKRLDIVYNRGTGLYDLAKHVIQPDSTVRTKQIARVSHKRLRTVIAEFFDTSNDGSSNSMALVEEMEIRCPSCGSDDMEIEMISECEPSSDCYCNKCSCVWIEQ